MSLTRPSGATVNQVARNIRMGSNLLSEYAVPVAARAERRSRQLNPALNWTCHRNTLDTLCGSGLPFLTFLPGLLAWGARPFRGSEKPTTPGIFLANSICSRIVPGIIVSHTIIE